MDQIKNSQIRSFLVAARHLNFTRAAEELYISQSVLSRQISALEDELGFELFIRHKKSIKLSYPGEILAQGLYRYEAQLESAISRARAAANGTLGELRIGTAIGQILNHKCRKALRTIREELPLIKIELVAHTLSAMNEALTKGDIDLALTSQYDTNNREDLDVHIIDIYRNSLVMSDTHRLAGREDLRLADFKNELFLNIAQTESPHISQNVYEFCRRAGFTPQIHEVPNISAVFLSLEMMDCVAIVNCESIINFLPSTKSLSFPEFDSTIHVAAWRKNNFNPIIQNFIANLEDQRK